VTVRKLTLKREALTELTSEQLDSVVGAATGTCTGGCTAYTRLKCDLTVEGPNCKLF
jgi:hypothetical protein